MSLPPSSASAPSPGFQCFAQWLQLTPAQSERLHAALVASGDRQARSVLFALERFSQRRSQSGMLRDLVRFSLGPGHPHRLVTLIETFVMLGLLSRGEANGITECLLAKMRQDGMWR